MALRPCGIAALWHCGPVALRAAPANDALCRGQIRMARVPTAKAWLHEGVGSLAVLAGAVEGLVSGEGGSLAGVSV